MFLTAEEAKTLTSKSIGEDYKYVFAKTGKSSTTIYNTKPALLARFLDTLGYSTYVTSKDEVQVGWSTTA